MGLARKNDWVEIENILLKAGNRAKNVSEDTQNVPLIERRKGYLLENDAKIGDEVEIETIIGRKVKGQLSEINPKHRYDFGNPIKELIDVGYELRKEIYLLEGGDKK